MIRSYTIDLHTWLNIADGVVRRMVFNKALKCIPAFGLHRTRAAHAPLS